MSKGVTMPAGMHSPAPARQTKSISGILDFSAARARVQQRLRFSRRNRPVVVKRSVPAAQKAPLTAYMIDPAYRKYTPAPAPRHHQSRQYKVVHLSQLPSLLDGGAAARHAGSIERWWAALQEVPSAVYGNLRWRAVRAVLVIKQYWHQITEAIAVFLATLRFGLLKYKKRITGAHYRINQPRHRRMALGAHKHWSITGGLLAVVVFLSVLALNPVSNTPPDPTSKPRHDASSSGSLTQKTENAGAQTDAPVSSTPSSSQSPVDPSQSAPRPALIGSEPTPQSTKPVPAPEPQPTQSPSLPVGGYGGEPAPAPSLPLVPITPLAPPKEPVDTRPLLPIVPETPEILSPLVDPAPDTITDIL